MFIQTIRPIIIFILILSISVASAAWLSYAVSDAAYVQQHRIQVQSASIVITSQPNQQPTSDDSVPSMVATPLFVSPTPTTRANSS